MSVASLIFAAIAAVGAVAATVVNSGPLLRLVEARHRRLDAVLADYRQMFDRTWEFVKDDLDESGHTKQDRAQAFTAVAGSEMYLHFKDPDEAWAAYRQWRGI